MAVRSLAEAMQYSKVYHVLMILVDLGGGVETIAQELGKALDATGGAKPPILGLTANRPAPEEMANLAQAGLVDIITADDPEPFFLWRLDLLRQLDDLRQYEKSRMDVGELAKQTRIHLHDMSQPLSAVQGRLQLMAAKCPPGDPNAKMYEDLVRLAFDITHQVMEIQQLHRQFS
jgi:hypothetical protein